MKIYHTETQVDYDALMAELEAQGFMWSFGRKLSESNNWHVSEHLTCIRVYDSEVDYASLNYYKEEYSQIPITKFKAKVNKMKFTKENIYKMVARYSVDQGYLLGDLKSDISKLDDTPEKVVVPKFVAEFYEECENATLEFLITELEATYSRIELGKWYRSCSGRHRNGNANAQEIIARMKLYGYEVEKEPLYCVNINGQYLVKMIPERNVHKFVEEVKLCVWDTQAYQLTEAEIKAIDERYIPFMVPVGEVNND